MRALEVKRNGKVLVVAGTANALMLDAGITSAINESGAVLDVRGMNDLGSDRASHTTWIDLSPLSWGDRLEVRFVETESPTTPIEEIDTDSDQYKADQAEYSEKLRTEPLTPRVLEVIQPNAALKLLVDGHEQVVATLEGGREFISCHLLWNRWRPERCCVCLSTFSQSEAIARAGSRGWFSGALSLGECCAITVGA